MQCHKYTLKAGMCRKQQHQFHVSSILCSYRNVQCTARHINISTLSGIATDRTLVSAVAYNWTKIFKDNNRTREITVVKSEADELLPQFFSILIFRCEEGILFLCSVLYAWYIPFILWKCVPIKLTVKNLPPRNAALLTRRPAMWRLSVNMPQKQPRTVDDEWAHNQVVRRAVNDSYSKAMEETFA